ncbi:MAG: DUF5815 family protein [Halodesulfurarchaeum sp.]
MAEPRIPGSGGTDSFELPCGETIQSDDLDLGMREYHCDCGATHAVVMDPHPPSRFFPESVVDTLRRTIKTSGEDSFDEFGTPHIMGIVMEEYPEEIVVHDAAEDGSVGYALAWVAEFDGRELHRVVVELVVELMQHAVSHAEDDSAMTAFEEDLLDFDVESFVSEYRDERDFEDEFDEPV